MINLKRYKLWQDKIHISPVLHPMVNKTLNSWIYWRKIRPSQTKNLFAFLSFPLKRF